jgi:hypothetical protein
MSEQQSAESVWVVIDVGCHECGVDSEPVGIFQTEAQAETAAENRFAETKGWRNGGQTICQVFAMTLPAGIDGDVSA